jgi:hypothetical protein
LAYAGADHFIVESELLIVLLMVGSRFRADRREERREAGIHATK